MLDIILSKQVIAPVIIILVSVLIYMILTRVSARIYALKISRQNDKKRETIRGVINNIIKYFIIIIDLAMILEIYGIDTKSIIASLGVVSLVAGLALQDILKDFIVGIAILFEDQFSVGDVVEIMGFKGTVIQFGMRTTKVKAYTGEVKIFANRNITELINYNLCKNTILIDFMISYDCDITKAKNVLTRICSKFTKETGDTFECLGVDELADSGVIIKTAITTEYDSRKTLARRFMEEVKDTFDKENIEIPYPQVVIHNGKRV